ncbi:MAG: TerB family tellurite resistance protein [Cellvibrionaceae bacterium]|nr:TerB family tellurite resistance protein [Cellvibrionaceae bacterium]
MKKLIDKLFGAPKTAATNTALNRQQLHLATAALLVEVATIDQNIDDRELVQLQQRLVTQCQLSAEDVSALIEDARRSSTQSASLYEFTRCINDYCSYQEKLQLMQGLWGVAYADGILDKYEEHIIRRIADLIHVSHRDFIRAKQQVRDANQ